MVGILRESVEQVVLDRFVKLGLTGAQDVGDAAGCMGVWRIMS